VYFADCTAKTGYDDYVVIGNRWPLAVTARLTFTREDGSGFTHDVTVPASARITLRVGDEAQLSNEDVSVAVQSLDTAHALDADHSVYWGPSWQSGRSTEGVSPASSWFFAEGSTNGFFDEYLTIYNPSNQAQDINVAFYGTNGYAGGVIQHIEPGPGRTKIHVNSIVQADHGISIFANTPIVAERTMTWAMGADQNGQVEGHSSPGQPGTNLSTDWYFAEGDTGFATFFALFNLYSPTSHVQIDYLLASGGIVSQTVDICGFCRVTVTPPSTLPLGSFGAHIHATYPLAAERSVYGGPNYTLGTNGVGVSAPRPTWYFAEGATGSFFDTYVLIANPSATNANVWLAFIREDGQLFWYNVQVAPNQRQSVLVDTVPGVTAANFRTEVRSDVPVVAERVTYWPGQTNASLLAASLTGHAPTGEAGLVSREPTLGFNPYTTLRPRAPALTLGFYQSVTDGESIGEPGKGTAATPATNATTGATTNDVNSGGWYGAHLTGGRP
jgi:hypothetical protein